MTIDLLKASASGNPGLFYQISPFVLDCHEPTGRFALIRRYPCLLSLTGVAGLETATGPANAGTLSVAATAAGALSKD